MKWGRITDDSGSKGQYAQRELLRSRCTGGKPVIWDLHQRCCLIWERGFQWREVQLEIRTKFISCPSWNSPQEHSHNESRWRREKPCWDQTPLPLHQSLHRTGQQSPPNETDNCLRCHGSCSVLIQLTITNQHDNLQPEILKLMWH